MLFRDAVEPEVAEVLRRIQEQATGAVAALMATEPAVRVDESDEVRDRGVRMMAQQLSGAMQSLALWWDDNPDVPRATLVDVAMVFCWLGLERVRDGERMHADVAPGAAAASRSGPRS
jgi:hypothetical protein